MLPAAPSVGASIRSALADFFYNSWRLVPANLIWGLCLFGVVVLLVSAPLIGLVAFLFMGPPTVGVFGLAGLIARGQPAAFSDSIAAWRRHLLPAVVTGVLVGASTVLLVFNILLGLYTSSVLGWLFATAAVWALLAVWAVAGAFWPLLVDPVRAAEPLSARLRLALAVVLVAPARYAFLMLVVLFVMVASTILFAALLTVTVAFVALVLCHYVLPLADRIEGRDVTP